MAHGVLIRNLPQKVGRPWLPQPTLFLCLCFFRVSTVTLLLSQSQEAESICSWARGVKHSASNCSLCVLDHAGDGLVMEAYVNDKHCHITILIMRPDVLDANTLQPLLVSELPFEVGSQSINLEVRMGC